MGWSLVKRTVVQISDYIAGSAVFPGEDQCHDGQDGTEKAGKSFKSESYLSSLLIFFFSPK